MLYNNGQFNTICIDIRVNVKIYGMKGLSTFFTLSSFFFRFLDTENRLLYGITTDTRPPRGMEGKARSYLIHRILYFFIFLFFLHFFAVYFRLLCLPMYTFRHFKPFWGILRTLGLEIPYNEYYCS